MYELNALLTRIKDLPPSEIPLFSLCGLNEGARAWLIHRAAALSSRPLLVLTAEEAVRERYRGNLQFFAPPGRTILDFPAWDTKPYEDQAPAAELSGLRLYTLFELLEGRLAPLVVASIRALMPRLAPHVAFSQTLELILAGEELDREQLLKKLTNGGYAYRKLVEERGSFSHRGGILDFFPPHLEHPVRLEFFGDTVESIRSFDPQTQRSLKEMKELVVLPAREYLWDPARNPDRERIALRLRKQTGVAPEEAEAAAKSLAEPGEFSGQPWLLPYYFDELESLFDYFPAPPLVFIDEPIKAEAEAESFWDEIVPGYEQAKAEGRPAAPPQELFSPYLAVKTALAALPRFELSDFPQNSETPLEQIAQFQVSHHAEVRHELLNVKGGEAAFQPLVNRLRRWQEEGYTVGLVCHIREQANRLVELLEPYHLATAFSLEPPAGPALKQSAPLKLYLGELSSGFVWPEELLALITEEEIFGPRKRTRPSRGSSPSLLASFADLKINDHVVHTEHGIALYRGMQRIQVGEMQADFLQLEYGGGDRLYVPIYHLEMVQKYLGGNPALLKLDTLGGKTWERKKKKVTASLMEMAGELLELYAGRKAAPGFSFSPPDNLYREFEASFPYEETPDQLDAINAVMKDMQSSLPMDRLVCGDVGFGKTEVAMRAAFKAVLDGKQVAVLVPTTILAQQHEETFRERLQNYPVKIEVLSRFRTKAEQKESVARLTAGTADIAIGTHRLLQADVKFSNLGLLIIDEEQRFGVKHKERLKQMRQEVDVLTLTATPIPRTLHMALSGIRDLSVINTPPAERQAIQTQVVPFRPEVIRGALLREIERGGQAFFVHNRVKSIKRLVQYLSQLVPEARFGVAHGQMAEQDLERIMAKYFHREFDVLVCTSIIESGLDIPAANTIIINRADTFGLSDMYQLRGRVGRSFQQAFAYLLVPPRRMLHRDAKRRLRALQELTELGSGLKLALQDLEIRGAGNLLGAKQSGHIQAVGLEMFMQLLEQTVRTLKGEKVVETPEPEINLSLSAFIPESYIPDTRQRLEFYKRLASAADEKEISELSGELKDRYGSYGYEIENLLKISALKPELKRLGIKRLLFSDDTLHLLFHESCPLPPFKIIELVQRHPKKYALSPEMMLSVPLAYDEEPFTRIKKLLKEIREFDSLP